jgi:hypothetical protein
MLRHDELIAIINKDNPKAVHGVDFWVAMPINPLTGVQTDQSFIAEWNLSTPCPTPEDIESYEVAYAAFIETLRNPSIKFVRSRMPSLTPRQLWLAAASIGVSKDQVLAKIDATFSGKDAVDLRIELTETVAFERSHPAISDLAGLLDVPADQLDSLWLWAAAL